MGLNHSFIVLLNEQTLVLPGVKAGDGPRAGTGRAAHNLPALISQLVWAFSTMVTMTSLTGTFQAVPMLRAQGDCDIKSSICCSLCSKEIKVNLNSLEAGLKAHLHEQNVDWGLHSAQTQGSS